MNNSRPKLAALYFIAARDDYRKWGAAAKVKHLEENYPKYLNLYTPASTLGSVTVAIGDSISEILDLRSILKASQTLSDEVHLKRLLEKMMAILIENAGAVRGLFIENAGGKLLIQAEAGPDGVELLIRFGSDLGEAVKNFDIANMREMLNDFPELLNRLKSADTK